MEIIRKGSSVLFCCLAFISLCNYASNLVVAGGVNHEVQALLGVKSLLVDPHGILNSWDEAAVDPCSWNMVTCSPNGLVVGLGGPSQDLSGTLSPAIGNLTNLQLVLLQENNIAGDIPSEIGKLSMLATLDLSNNSFSGQIPSTMSHLQSLQYLKLNNNNLSGEIPDSLANLTQLRLLDLSFNNLSGNMPMIPAKVEFSILGNPYIGCSTEAEGKGGCPGMDSRSLPSSSKAELSYPSGMYISGVFYVMLILASKIFP